MAEEVKVQSGVALGMKIGCGLLLFFLILTGGTCVACGACAAVGAGGAAAEMTKATEARRAQAANHRGDIAFSGVQLSKDGHRLSFEFKNGSKSTITRAIARAYGNRRDGGESFTADVIVVNPYSADPLPPGAISKRTVEIADAGGGTISVDLTLMELELERRQ